MYNRRMRIGSYLYLWGNTEGKKLYITQMIGHEPYKQLGFETDGDGKCKIVYYGFAEHSKNQNKVITISTPCYIYDNLRTLAQTLGSQHKGQETRCPILQDCDNTQQKFMLDYLPKSTLKFLFHLKTPYSTALKISDENKIFEKFIDKSFDQLNLRYISLDDELKK